MGALLWAVETLVGWESDSEALIEAFAGAPLAQLIPTRD